MFFFFFFESRTTESTIGRVTVLRSLEILISFRFHSSYAHLQPACRYAPARPPCIRCTYSQIGAVSQSYTTPAKNGGAMPALRR